MEAARSACGTPLRSVANDPPACLSRNGALVCCRIGSSHSSGDDTRVFLSRNGGLSCRIGSSHSSRDDARRFLSRNGGLSCRIGSSHCCRDDARASRCRNGGLNCRNGASHSAGSDARVFVSGNGCACCRNGARHSSGDGARGFLSRSGGACCRSGAFVGFSDRPSTQPAGRDGEICGRAQAREADVETVKAEAAGDDGEDEEFDIESLVDKEGNLTDSLPDEFLELMKDEGTPPNYWLVGLGLTAAYLAREAIWTELKRWGKFAALGVVVALNLALAGFAKLIKLGGDPLVKVVIVFGWVGLTIYNFFRFIAAIVPFGPVMFAVSLSSLVLLVGESASGTYNSSQGQFPSRNILDVAGLLGLGGFVGIIPEEIMVLGLVAITVFLLGVKKVNPVAGFTPAAAAFAAVSTPIIRYPVLVSFVGFAVYRSWRLGYLSQGAVLKERTAEYPRVLIGLLYLVGIALVARTCFSVFDFVRAAIYVIRA